MALAGYIGLGPFVACRSRSRPTPPSVRHHLHQAAGVWSLLLFVILFYTVSVAYISYTILSGVDGTTYGRLESFALSTGRRLFLAWLVFWCFGFALALMLSDRRMPVAGWLGQFRPVRALVWATQVAFFLAVLILAPTAWYASSLLSTEPPQPVVLLYEDNGFVPRWIFSLGFLPIALAAREELGDGRVRAERLTDDSLHRALKDARFLFIGSHGGESGLYVEGKYYPPERLRDGQPHPQLEYVYLAGCESGALRKEWEQVFSPARVMAFDRVTAVVEHIWWLWTRGPEAVRMLD